MSVAITVRNNRCPEPELIDSADRILSGCTAHHSSLRATQLLLSVSYIIPILYLYVKSTLYVCRHVAVSFCLCSPPEPEPSKLPLPFVQSYRYVLIVRSANARLCARGLTQFCIDHRPSSDRYYYVVDCTTAESTRTQLSERQYRLYATSTRYSLWTLLFVTQIDDVEIIRLCTSSNNFMRHDSHFVYHFTHKIRVLDR